MCDIVEHAFEAISNKHQNAFLSGKRDLNFDLKAQTELLMPRKCFEKP